MSRILLLSTYELGSRPLGCTVPAALLEQAGHQVRAVDLSLEDWPAAELARADGVVLSVPMHTALRLGVEVLRRLRSDHPRLPVLLHGLYAEGAADAAGALLGPGDLALSGELGETVVEWAGAAGRSGRDGGPSGDGAGAGRSRDARSPQRRHVLGPPRPGARPPQSRAGLPALDRYARLSIGGEERLVGTVETTTGCNHRCRHCPVPVVYRGRTRPVALESVLAEVDQLVAEGARHLHLADPDFLNRPAHALGFVRSLHLAHPDCTFDVTAKVSHLLRHRHLLAELAGSGLVFVTSALESTSDLVLDRLDKGHTNAEGVEAVRLLRRHGVEPRPSFLPFTPWTVRQDLVDLFDLVAAEDLTWNVDLVQFGIRLLLPPGSLLLEGPDPVLAASLLGEDPSLPGTAWRSADPLLDDCQRRLAALAEQLTSAAVEAPVAYRELRAALFDVLGSPDPGVPEIAGIAGPPGPGRPHLTESWFCCAEPTGRQLASVGAGAVPPAIPPDLAPAVAPTIPPVVPLDLSTRRPPATR